MPTGPKGQKRPADVVSNAVHVMKVLTGEAADGAADDGKDANAKALGKKGGAARAANMTPERRGDRQEGGGEAVGEQANLIASKHIPC